jgi:TRAP-type C4-dicarboxylate transport system substrate-binding protein
VKKKSLLACAVLSTAALTLSACAGSAGSSGSGGGNAGDGAGFAYGASQDEVDEALADLEPVTLTYQPAAASTNSVLAPAALEYKEAIEERSGGKITLDIVWGQAIAGYSEIDDALADGRLDLAYSLPIYDPSKYPTFDALSSALHSLPSSPVAGEAIYSAVASDLGWQTDGLIEDYEAQGIVPLSPFIATGAHYALCGEEGSAPEDWKGRQIRTANSSQQGLVTGLGATPVSMEYGETYEALQRGTVDCTYSQLSPAAEGGFLEVASHLSYTDEENSLPGRAVGAQLAGSTYQNLPLAYQQIIFDAGSTVYSGMVGVVVDGNAEAVRQVKAAGGTIDEFDSGTADLIDEAQEAQFDELVAGGLLGDDLDARIQESLSTWQSAADEAGVEDEGSFETVDEWWERGDADFAAIGDALYEQSALAHRPE